MVLVSMQLYLMRLEAAVDCPDVLTVPLCNYTVKFLVAFIKLQDGKPPKQGSKKEVCIKFIVDNYRNRIEFDNAVVEYIAA